MYVEIDLITDPNRARELDNRLSSVLGDVREVVEDAEKTFLGMYTTTARHEKVLDIPVVCGRVREVMTATSPSTSSSPQTRARRPSPTSQLRLGRVRLLAR
jgi:NAD-specific glutamate dehydrogenase